MISLQLWSYSPLKELKLIMNEYRKYLHPHENYHKIVSLSSLPSLDLKCITLGCLCHRLVDGIIKIIAAQATKQVTLGHLRHSDLIPDRSLVSRPHGKVGVPGATGKIGREDLEVEEIAVVSCKDTNADDVKKRMSSYANAAQARAPKK